MYVQVSLKALQGLDIWFKKAHKKMFMTWLVVDVTQNW